MSSYRGNVAHIFKQKKIQQIENSEISAKITKTSKYKNFHPIEFI